MCHHAAPTLFLEERSSGKPWGPCLSSICPPFLCHLSLWLTLCCRSPRGRGPNGQSLALQRSTPSALSHVLHSQSRPYGSALFPGNCLRSGYASQTHSTRGCAKVAEFSPVGVGIVAFLPKDVLHILTVQTSDAPALEDKLCSSSSMRP